MGDNREVGVKNLKERVMSFMHCILSDDEPVFLTINGYPDESDWTKCELLFWRTN